MTVTGTVDPVDVIVQARKAGRRASVVTIGPPPKPAAEEKKPEQQKTDETVGGRGEEGARAAGHGVRPPRPLVASVPQVPGESSL